MTEFCSVGKRKRLRVNVEKIIDMLVGREAAAQRVEVERKWKIVAVVSSLEDSRQLFQ